MESVQPEVPAQAEDRGHVPVGRVFTLLDGVVAIAMTILVLDVRLPPNLSGPSLTEALGTLGEQIQYFLLSVVVIGLFWRGHQQVLKETAYIDTTLLWLNFAFLALLSLIPFPTDALENYSRQPVGPALYGTTIALTALVELLMWLHIVRPKGPARREIEPRRRRNITAVLWLTVVIFGVSVPIAFVSPAIAVYSWLLLIPARVVLRRISMRRR